jgi:hypothetical protein
MITSFMFAGSGVEDLTTGCQPFLVSYAGTKALQESNEVAGLAQQLEQGTTQTSLADVRAIRDKEHLKLPSDLHQVSITLQQFAVLTHTLFQSEQHAGLQPLVHTMWNLAETFATRGLPFYVERHMQFSGKMHSSYPTRGLR